MPVCHIFLRYDGQYCLKLCRLSHSGPSDILQLNDYLIMLCILANHHFHYIHCSRFVIHISGSHTKKSFFPIDENISSLKSQVFFLLFVFSAFHVCLIFFAA
jgi:hypothetical protein